MKNIKFNEKLKTRIISGGLSLILVASGYCFGKLTSNDDELVNEYLVDYIKERDSLEEEISELLEEKERLENVEAFSIGDLVVMEHTDANNESNLYILNKKDSNDICNEYHGTFKAWYNLHAQTDEHIFGFCNQYVHFYEYQPLFDYLTDKEIETLSNNGGNFTTAELDGILGRIRSEYNQQLSEKGYSKSLTDN